MVKKTLPTKRQIIAITTKCYDPFVFISPIVICFKILFQAMCINICWDEPLTGETAESVEVTSTYFPRCVNSHTQVLFYTFTEVIESV